MGSPEGLVSASWRGKPVRRSRPKTVPLHDASVTFPHYKDELGKLIEGGI